METHHQGARNAGRPMLLEGGLDWKPMGFCPSDMEFQKTKEAAARDVALAFGVPPMLLGMPGDTTYANYQEANRAFYRLTVLPLATRVSAAMSGTGCRPAAGEELELKPDLDQVPALAEERDPQWARVGAAAFLSEAEKRALLGLPAPGGGCLTWRAMRRGRGFCRSRSTMRIRRGSRRTSGSTEMQFATVETGGWSGSRR